MEVPPVPWRQLRAAQGLTSEHMRQQVVRARKTQRERFASAGNGATTTTATMSSQQTRKFCKLDQSGETLLKQAVTELGLSARAHDKILCVARTIADIEFEQDIQAHHIAEAVQYRRLDRQL